MKRSGEGSEQWVVDRLVEAVDVGDGDAKARFAEAWLNGFARHDWRRAVEVDSGLIHPLEEPTPLLAPPKDVLDGLEYLQADDLEVASATFYDGPDLSEAKRREWCRLAAERAFSEELAFDGTHGRVWVILRLVASNRRSAHVAVIDWADDGGRFVAAYQTASEGRRALQVIGYVNHNDYLARSPNARL